MARPNILFLFPDQHRFDWIGANPDLPVRTPNLDSLGECGVRFSNAVCPSPVCSPSRACLAMGVEYDNCPVPTNAHDIPEGGLMFYRLLHDAGYSVAGCGKFDLRKGAMDWGGDGNHPKPEPDADGHRSYFEEWGFTHGVDSAGKWDCIHAHRRGRPEPFARFLEGRGLWDTHEQDYVTRREHGGYAHTAPTALPDDAYGDNWVGARAVQLVRDFPKDRPWFIQVNFPGPHDPEDITASMHGRWQDVDFPPPGNSGQHTPETHVAIRRNYSAMVENIDRWLGLLLQEVGARGELVNTLVVYSSDHGDMLGDHDAWAKCVWYHPSVSVPLVVAGPRVISGAVIDAPVTNMDLAATFLEWAGVDVPQDWDSRTLGPILTGAADRTRDVVRSGLTVGAHDWRMAYDGRYKLVDNRRDGELLLYDRGADPLEGRNMADERPDVVARLRGQIN